MGSFESRFRTDRRGPTLTRRRFVSSALAGTAGVAGAALIGCSSNGSKPTTPGSASPAAGAPKGNTLESIIGKNWGVREAGTAPKYGGALYATWGNTQLPHFDPINSATSTFPFLVFSNAYSSLLQLSRTVKNRNEQMIYPGLAASWEATDPLKMTFKLQSGVKWHNVAPVNGRALTAEDVKYAALRTSADPQSLFRGTFDAIKSIDTPDASTVVINTKRFDPVLLRVIASHFLSIHPKELVDAGKSKQMMIGTGPFVFEKWEQDSRISYKKNPDYFMKGLPFADELHMMQFSNAETSFAAFKSKQLSNRRMSFQEMESIKSDKNVVSEEFLAVGASVFFMNASDPLWKDVRVRRAMSLVIDKDVILKIGSDGHGLWRGVLSAQNAGWALSQDELKSKRFYMRQDLQEAKQLVTAAGLPNGITGPLSFDGATAQSGRDTVQYVAETAAKAGVAQLTLVPMERAALRRNQDEQKYTGLLYGADGQGLPELFLLDYRSGGPKNGMGLKDPAIDAEIDKMMATVDEKERIGKAQDLARKFLEDVMWKITLSDNKSWDAWHSNNHNYLGSSPMVENTFALAYTWQS